MDTYITQSGTVVSYKQVQSMVSTALRGRLTSHEEIEDIVSLVSEKVWESYDSERGRLSTFVYATTDKLLVDKLRREGRRIKCFDLDDRSFIDKIQRREQLTGQEVVTEISKRVDDDQVEMLCFLARGQTFDEISRALEIPRGTVSSRISRAKEKLLKQGLAEALTN